MYAVFEDRSQQFRVAPGDQILLPLNAALEPGASVTFDKVCVVGGDNPQIGTPFVEGASITATVVGSVKGPKLVVQKFKKRKNYRCRTGFRARYTAVRIETVNA